MPSTREAELEAEVERLREALPRLLALLLAEHDAQGDDIVPAGVWTSLHDEGLVQTAQDITGEYATRTTAAGSEAFEREARAALNHKPDAPEGGT